MRYLYNAFLQTECDYVSVCVYNGILCCYANRDSDSDHLHFPIYVVDLMLKHL